MKHPLLLLALGALLVPLTATPSAALFEQKIVLRSDSIHLDTTNVLDANGRLASSLAMRNVYEFSVELPPIIGQCPFGTISVAFSLKAKPDYAVATLSPSIVTKVAPTLQSGLTPTIVAGFVTTQTIVLQTSAPHLEAGVYVLYAQAFPSANSTGGCLLAPSDPVTVSIIVVTA